MQCMISPRLSTALDPPTAYLKDFTSFGKQTAMPSYD